MSRAVTGSTLCPSRRVRGGQVQISQVIRSKGRDVATIDGYGLFRETVGSDHYVMVAITPQTNVDASRIAPREMVFVQRHARCEHESRWIDTVAPSRVLQIANSDIIVL